MLSVVILNVVAPSRRELDYGSIVGDLKQARVDQHDAFLLLYCKHNNVLRNGANLAEETWVCIHKISLICSLYILKMVSYQLIRIFIRFSKKILL
jgi:hypothetical protein